ncbi:hypothetical protein EYF80_051585 [Liparis tanakae]|uniref:Uncharacterized protein n=1 Tax=Liparis tanakae TaxID=230148 RepID=A0A4Z2FD03_9TELE|nr:hypothetical protein EYF80_051585 [Liparis tanakae]
MEHLINCTFEELFGDNANRLPAAPDGVSNQSGLHPAVVIVAKAEKGIVLLFVHRRHRLWAFENPTHDLFVDDEYAASKTGVDDPAEDRCEYEESGQDEESKLKVSDSLFVVYITRLDNRGVFQQRKILESGWKLALVLLNWAQEGCSLHLNLWSLQAPQPKPIERLPLSLQELERGF